MITNLLEILGVDLDDVVRTVTRETHVDRLRSALARRQADLACAEFNYQIDRATRKIHAITRMLAAAEAREAWWANRPPAAPPVPRAVEVERLEAAIARQRALIEAWPEYRDPSEEVARREDYVGENTSRTTVTVKLGRARHPEREAKVERQLAALEGIRNAMRYDAPGRDS